MTNHPETPTNKTTQDVPGDPIWDNYQDDLDVPIVSATPGQAISRFFIGWFRFGGKASRREYWWPAVIVTAIMLSIFSALYYFSTIPSPSSEFDITLACFWMFFFILSLIMIFPVMAVTMRRLRDAGHYPWLVWIIFLPILGPIALWILCAFPSKDNSQTETIESLAP